MTVPRIVIVGAGFAGYECARRLERRLGPAEAEILMVTPTDYTLYPPLLPQVAAGVLEPKAIVGSLHRKLDRTQLVPGVATGVDLKTRTCEVMKIDGVRMPLSYDRLVLCTGSVTRSFDIPGLTEHAYGLKNLAEAIVLRDHVLAELELANAAASDQERAARCGFLVVGGGYSGVETAANLQLLTSKALREFPRIDPADLRWTLVDLAPRLLPELGEHLGDTALRKMRHRGVKIRLETSVDKITEDAVQLTDGTSMPCRTVIWTAGVTPSPVIDTLGTETARGRLVVGADMQVPGHPEVFALGDAAAVPDLTGPDGTVCGPTAQHATRQGPVAADNVIASLRDQALKNYRHRDLGMVVDLGGAQAVARPLGINLSGPPAQLVTRAYHLLTAPSGRAKIRITGDWLMHLLAGNDLTRLGFVDDGRGAFSQLEHLQPPDPAESRR